MGIIYFIQCLDTNEIYIGSTKQSIKKRMINHKSHSKKNDDCSSKQIIDRDNYIYDVLEEVDDNDKLREREQYYLDTTDCINVLRAVEDKQKRKEYVKQYNQVNLEKYKEVITCECGNTYTLRNKARHMKSKKHINLLSSCVHNRHQATF